jgi:ABC-type Fe3+ transport system substrate-binding protein
LKVDVIFPSHLMTEGEGAPPQGAGTLLTPNSVARVKGGPNPVQAKVLIDFLLSEEVERALSESDSHNVPLRWPRPAAGSQPTTADDPAQYAVPDPLKIDWEKAASSRGKAIEEFLAAMDAVKQDRAAAAELAKERAAAASQPDTQEGVPATTKPGEGGNGGG